MLWGRRACRTCYEDASRMLLGSYKETVSMEISLYGVGKMMSCSHLGGL